MIFRVTDIETIPDHTMWTQNKPSYKLAKGVDCELGSPSDPLYFKGNIAAVEEADAFPPPQAQRVVAISYVDIIFDPMVNPRYRFDKCYTACRWSKETSELDAVEASLLKEFSVAMATSDVHLVTWNGRGFDLPVITMRSFRHRIPCGWYYTNKDMRYRFSAEGHCDLMDFMGDFGAVRSMKLADVAHLIGLPGKTDMTGASVEGLYRSTVDDPSVDIVKAQADTARYCLQDSIQTALIFVATRYHFGKVTLETHNAIIDTFANSEVIRNAIDLDWDKLKLTA